MTTEETVTLRVGSADVRAVLCRPDGAPRGGVALGAEAVGINPFIISVATRLAEAGYVTIVADYFHGEGPADPDAIYNPEHIPDIQRYIGALDFTRGTHDVLSAVDYLRDVEGLDRVSVWGYCTGGTLTFLAATLDRGIDAAVLFYPSQPVFHQHSPLTPVDPIDLIWNIRCRLLLLVGANDALWPAQLVQATRERLEHWSVPHEIVVYPDADHVFAGHFGDSFRADAAHDAWRRGLALLEGPRAQP